MENPRKAHRLGLCQLLVLLLVLSLSSCSGGAGGGNVEEKDTVHPSIPTGLTAIPVSSSQIDLSWTPSTDNVAVTGYDVYRNGSFIKSVILTTYSDTGLTQATQYCYSISALDAAGNDSGRSMEVCAATRSCDVSLGDFNGVIAYLNKDICPCGQPVCYSYVGNTYMGEKWQCVEYVRRYYFLHYDLDLASKYRGDANTWYANASMMGLESYENDGQTEPRVGDILVSNGGPAGHIAIVSSIGGGKVCTIQQNFFNDTNDVNRCLDIGSMDGVIGGFSSTYPIKGWLRSAHLFASSGVGTSQGPSDLYNIGSTINGADFHIGRIRTSSGFEPVITDLALTPNKILYGVSFDRLYQIDQKTALATQIGVGLGRLGFNALASDMNGNLYGATTAGELMAIDANSGVARVIGFFGSGYASKGDIAFSPNGILYASVGDSAGKDILVTVDPNTGVASRINGNIEIGFKDVWGLCVVNNELYGLGKELSTGLGVLIKINTGTGGGQIVRQIGFIAFGAMDIGKAD